MRSILTVIIGLVLFIALANCATNELSADDKSNILDYISAIRARVQPPPANMKAITWDPILEEESLAWVSQCKFGSDKSIRGVRGQAFIASGSNAQLTYQQVLLAWESESVNYAGDIANSYKALNYTQMVWWSTNRVGCAMVTCPTLGQYWHCTWAPRGNFRGLRPSNSTCVPQSNPCGNTTCGLVSDGCKSVKCGPPCNSDCPNGVCASSAPATAQYIGCYVDSDYRDMTGSFFQYYAMTVDTCISSCRSAGFQYAGLQAGSQCFCGNSYGQLGMASDWECYVPCGGNGFEQCGGWYRNAVYSIKRDVKTPVCNTVVSYAGCYIDSDFRDVSGTVTLASDMTVESCTSICKSQGYSVAAVQFASQCFCGSTYGYYGRASEYECNVPCMGNSLQMCGGPWRNNIYTITQQCTDPDVPVAPVNPPVAPVNPPVDPIIPVDPPVDPIPVPVAPVAQPDRLKFSWTDRGFSSPVKDQGACGSCWAFSAVTLLETNWAIKNQRPPPELSTQQALDCADSRWTCNGGWTTEVFNFAQSNNGLALAEDYKYTASKGSCQRKTSYMGRSSGVNKLSSGSPTGDSNIIAQLQSGVLSAGINSQGLPSYQKGIFPCVGGKNIDHAVVIVGYGTDADGRDYWLVRNSWGPWWGEGGYVRIARGSNDCSLKVFVEKANIA